jgi:hypothetical protein
MKMRWPLAAMAFVELTVSSIGQIKVSPYPYEGANYVSSPQSDALRIFPSKRNAITIAFPFRLRTEMFGPDGKSIYGIIIADRKTNDARDQSGLSKVEFNPIRVSPVPGTIGLNIRSFAVSSRQDRLVVSGNLHNANCGVFEILLPDGKIRQVLSYDCHNLWDWVDLSLSPNGEQAVATVGSNIDHDLHLELIDLVHGTTKSLGDEFCLGAWSPDGKWIVVRKSGPRDELSLLDAVDFSRRRALGGVVVLAPEWSPDSRYILVWSGSLFRCGLYADLDGPSTLQTLDIQTGKRSTIQSSRCQITRSNWLDQ